MCCLYYLNKEIKAHLKASVDKTFIVEFLKHPPDSLHEPGVHCFIVILEVNPTTKSSHNVLKSNDKT